MKPKRLEQLSLEELRSLIESLKGQLTDALPIHRITGIKKRIRDLTHQLQWKMLRDDPNRLSDEIVEAIQDELNRPRKGRCKVPKSVANGFKKLGFDAPLGTGRNKIRMDRSKIRIGRG